VARLTGADEVFYQFQSSFRLTALLPYVNAGTREGPRARIGPGILASRKLDETSYGSRKLEERAASDHGWLILSPQGTFIIGRNRLVELGPSVKTKGRRRKNWWPQIFGW